MYWQKKIFAWLNIGISALFTAVGAVMYLEDKDLFSILLTLGFAFNIFILADYLHLLKKQKEAQKDMENEEENINRLREEEMQRLQNVLRREEELRRRELRQKEEEQRRQELRKQKEQEEKAKEAPVQSIDDDMDELRAMLQGTVSESVQNKSGY